MSGNGLTKAQVVMSIAVSTLTILAIIGGGVASLKAYADNQYSSKIETTQEIVTTVTWIVETTRIEEELVSVDEDITIHEFKIRNLPGGERDQSVEAFELSQAEKKKLRLETKLGQLNNSKPVGIIK